MAKSRRAGIAIGVIIFAIVVAALYAIIYAAPRIEGFGIKTDVVQYDELPIADTVTALFVRDETLYTAAYSGTPTYMVEDGTKVRAGTQVMYIEPGSGPASSPDVVISQDTGVPMAAEAARAWDGDGENPETATQETVFEALLRTAGADTEVSEGGVSPWTAIVSYCGDGWEKKITPENIMSITRNVFDEAPGESTDLRRDWAWAGEPVYRITNNLLWHIAFWINDADKTIIDKYMVGRKVMIDLGTTKVRASVEAVDPRGRDLFIVLRSDMYYKDLDKYRKREVSVVFSEVSGAVIERQAVKLKGGRAGVYVRQQNGTFKWVPVQVLKESGGRYLVAETSFDDEDGKIFNRNGNNEERQVLLRTDTFNSVLDNVYEFSLLHMGDVLKTDSINNDDILCHCNMLIRDSGYKCGRAFAEREATNFLKVLTFETKSKSNQEKLELILKEWCKFDSEAGFGKFSVSKITEQHMSDGQVAIKLRITLKESFVAEKLPKKIKVIRHYNCHSKRCEFMRGYCEGVCDELSEKSTLYPEYEFKIDGCDKGVCRFEKGNNVSRKCIYIITGQLEPIEPKTTDKEPAVANR